ncbi:hypothetical protein NHX12_003631 [Muraenolepis orangiensis]|uniref:Uncharacterized protein n=1 Tax=Muraenolepis orangiensis TaxID=630683 RepID=A0A9Q0ID39_9TELE|nr:hypothetical protein NHX12_003631 [Muraenolepis orangiensis]
MHPYLSVLRSPFPGTLCDEDVGGCGRNRCENGGTCSPQLVRGRHTYWCVCPAGFAGPRCRTPTTTTTTFSFKGNGGYLRVETRGLLRRDPRLRVTFGFRTRGPAGTLLQCRAGDLLLAVELLGGRLRLVSRRGGRRRPGFTLVQELPGHVSDGEWHAAEASLGAGGSLIRLLCPGGGGGGGDGGSGDGGSDCGIGGDGGIDNGGGDHVGGGDVGGTGGGRDSVGPGLPGGLTPVCQSLFLGAAELEAEEHSPAAFFHGCFRNVLVDSRPVAPRDPGRDSDAAQANVTVGCEDEDGCEAADCQEGECEAWL